MNKSFAKPKTSISRNSNLNISEGYIKNWLFHFNELKKYEKKFKTTCILKRDENHKLLYEWCKNQKDSHEAKLIHEECQKKLDKIDFFWESNENEVRYQHIWDGHFEKVKKYFEINSTTSIAARGNKKLRKLADWVVFQRMFYNKGTLSEYRIKKLNSINFIWKLIDPICAPDNEKWSSKLAELENYKMEYGNCNVPQTRTEYKKLGRWLNDQRVAYKRNQLEKFRLESLEKLGVIWDMKVYHFEGHIKELIKYKQNQGDFRVPINYKENTALGYFVYRLNTEGISEQWKKDRLLEIGFEDINILEKKEETRVTKRWLRMLEKLKYLHKKGVDVNIERNYNPNPQLADWVYNQKRAFKNNKLKDVQIEKLQNLGLNFEDKSEIQEWNDIFQIVALYKKYNGTTNVPETFDKTTHNWMIEQQKAFKEKTIKLDRLNKLETIGFEW